MESGSCECPGKGGQHNKCPGKCDGEGAVQYQPIWFKLIVEKMPFLSTIPVSTVLYPPVWFMLMSNLISGLWIWVEQEEQSDLLWSGFWRRRGCDRPESNFCKNSHQDCSRLVSRVKMILKQQLNMSRQARRVNLENTLFSIDSILIRWTLWELVGYTQDLM